MSGQRVAPTYPFPITYVPGGGIHPHLDVSDNELSLTFQVGAGKSTRASRLVSGGELSLWPWP